MKKKLYHDFIIISLIYPPIFIGAEIKFIHTLLFILLTSTLSFARQTTLQNVTLDVKQNGILIEMELEKAIDQENIAAWQSDSDWFYITLYQVTGDSSKLAADKLPEGIRDFQVIISQESTQLGVRLHHPIEYYDITQDETAYQILASLHYPSDLFTALPALQQYDTMDKELGMPKSLRSWMYITGFALTVNGLLTQEQDETNWETKIGLGTLFATYIADKLWPKS